MCQIGEIKHIDTYNYVVPHAKSAPLTAFSQIIENQKSNYFWTDLRNEILIFTTGKLL
jgi:hypothetical protein